MKFNFLNHEISSVHAAAFLLGAAGLLSRILGVLRDRLLAGTFGAGRELDAYYAAFQIPDFMAILFLLGAGTAAILPIFQEYLSRDREEARRLISEISSVFIYGAISLSFLLFIFVPQLVRFIAPGFTEDDLTLTASLSRIMLLSPILLGFSSIFSSVVQSFQRFWAYALAPILYNIGIILGVLFLVPFFGIFGLALGVILGALLHFFIQLFPMIHLGFLPKIFLPRISEGVKKIIGLSFPRVLSVSMTQLTLVVLVAIGSTLTEGSIAVFQLARNLYFVPIGIFGVSYAVAIFPHLSRAFIYRRQEEFFQELFLGIRSILFWTIPFTVLFLVLRAHIVRAALGAGLFSWEDTRLTAAALAVLVLAMWAEGLSSLLIKAFYALENTRVPLFINVGASALSILSAYFFTLFLGSNSVLGESLASLFRIGDIAHPEVLGLALGFTLGVSVNIAVLYGSLIRLARKTLRSDYPFPRKAIFKILTAALLAGVAAYIVRVSFSETLPLITFARVLIQGLITGVIGFAIYFGVLFLLRSEDMYSLWRSFERRFFRTGVLPPSWDGENHLHQHRM